MNNWIKCEEQLPPGGYVVLGWGSDYETEKLDVFLCGLCPTTGWCEYPTLESIEVFKWMPIQSPEGEYTKLFKG